MIVYMVLNSKSGKTYVGSTTRPMKERIRAHFAGYHKSSKELSADVAKLGKEKFFVSVLSKHESYDSMRAAEIAAIKDFDCIEHGYNTLISSQGKKPEGFGETIRKVRTGKNLSEKSKEKISKSKTGVSIWPNGRPKAHYENGLAATIEKNSLPVKCSNGKIYKSAAEAARELGMSKSGVTSVCNGRRNSCNGYTFEKVTAST